MDRNEAVLRELNLYPQWVRRELPADECRGTARRADAGAEASCVPAENRAASEADTQYVAQPVLSSDEGRNPSFASDMPVEAEAEPAAAIASDEAGREQLIARLGWPELKTMVRDCTACKLRAGCTQTVFGVGDQQAGWLFVGEGPGADEDERGEPFVGQAGKLLDSMLLALKLKRGDNVYIANVVKCHPPANRTPEADEIATCLPYLQRQIKLIRPRVIVALGKTAATALLKTGDVTLGSLRGEVHDYDGIPLIVTYHPAYLLRSPMEKAHAWQDLCLARQKYSL
ncbi:MAG: uracil-DNA glycosylase [Gallionella sp.]|jgi:DNA polymerase|nr:uracil-DNA glycosylase [Gallionella sp.]MCK9354368.1 uracil-DNA glycosylase [Gallionella sp.]